MAGISFPADSRDCMSEGSNYIKNGFGVGREVFVLSYTTQSLLDFSQISKTYTIERSPLVIHFCCFNYEQHSHRTIGNKVMTDCQILIPKHSFIYFSFFETDSLCGQGWPWTDIFLPLQECATMPILKHSFSNNAQTLRKFLRSNLKSQSNIAIVISERRNARSTTSSLLFSTC